ncbi:MAG TPA: MFS transporter, partial [Bryobacteraceae bacterium]|nr:MFS transporter [Bryobacteraceae bacterium]
FSAWLPPNEKVRAQGALWMCARWGGAFTPPLVGLVMAAVGWRHAFELFGLIGVVWAILFYRWYHDDPMRHPGLNETERQLLRENAKLASTHGRLPWRNFLRARQTWLLCIQYFSHSYGFYFYITWLPTYLKDGRHMALTATALLSVLPLFFGGIGSSSGSLIAKPLARWTGSTGRARRLVALTGFAGACLFLTLSTAVANPVQAMLAIGLASFSSDLVMSSAWSATMDVGGKYAGTLSGAMNMWGNIGGSLSPIAIGLILAASNNWNLTFYLSAAVYLIGFTCWLFLDPVTPIEGAVEG